jgi:hypothetical protein
MAQTVPQAFDDKSDAAVLHTSPNCHNLVGSSSISEAKLLIDSRQGTKTMKKSGLLDAVPKVFELLLSYHKECALEDVTSTN